MYYLAILETMIDLLEKASTNIFNRLSWHTGLKDQAAIAADLASGKDIQEVYGLGEAGLFDEFFCFLDEVGISSLFESLAPKFTVRKSNIKFPAVILIYLMRIVSGLNFYWHIEPVLLLSQPLMRLVGFNGREIREGTTSRGLPKGASDKKNRKTLQQSSIIQ